MHYSLIKKSNTSHIAIITVSLLSLIAIVFAMLFFLRAFQLKKALTHLDVSDENSIIRIMKYAGKDSDTVLHIAREYSSNQLYSECARLLLYILQYLDSDCDEALKLLQDCYFKLGADDRFIAAFSNPKFTLSDFEVTSRYAGDAYGFADGIYSEFLGGYAKAKISSICPVSISAC